MYFEDLPQEIQHWIRKQHKSFAIVVKFTNNFAPIQYVDVTDDPEVVLELREVIRKNINSTGDKNRKNDQRQY